MIVFDYDFAIYNPGVQNGFIPFKYSGLVGKSCLGSR